MADGLTRLLIDTSAWHHSRNPVVAERWERSAEGDRLAITAPVRLEILYSARNAKEYARISAALDGLHQIACTERAFARALDVQRSLVGLHPPLHRGVKLPDLLVAAVAELNHAIVWHYDSDYDRISEVTGQPTEWIAPRGSL